MQIYSSDDAGAPVLTNVQNVFSTILKACLVDGYGSKPAAGWSMPYSGSNLFAFRAGGGNQRYLQLDESAAVAASPYTIKARGYEVMTAANAGTGLFPTAVQEVNGLSLHRSNNATTPGVARRWLLAATDRIFYFFYESSQSQGSYPGFLCFGDFVSTIPGDQYNTLALGHPGAVTQTTQPNFLNLNPLVSTTPATYVARASSQLGTALLAGKHSDAAKVPATLGIGNMAFPNADGGLYVAPIFIHDPAVAGSAMLRGRLPGLWTHCHLNSSFADRDTFQGTGDMAGKTFMIIGFGPTAMSNGSLVLETSDTWS